MPREDLSIDLRDVLHEASEGRLERILSLIKFSRIDESCSEKIVQEVCHFEEELQPCVVNVMKRDFLSNQPISNFLNKKTAVSKEE